MKVAVAKATAVDSSLAEIKRCAFGRNLLKLRIKRGKAMKKNNFWETVIRIAIAALTAALTALGTTSCMGCGPF